MIRIYASRYSIGAYFTKPKPFSQEGVIQKSRQKSLPVFQHGDNLPRTAVRCRVQPSRAAARTAEMMILPLISDTGAPREQSQTMPSKPCSIGPYESA